MRLSVIMALAAAIAVSGSVRAAEDSLGAQVPLAEALKGLEPAPRIAYLRHLASTGGADAEIFFQLALAFHESAAHDSAETYYVRAIELSPRMSKAYVNLGVLYDETGRAAEALAMFAQGAAANPRDCLAHAHAAFLLWGRGEYEKADAEMDAAIEADPASPQPRFYRAVWFWESGIYREALAEWEAVVALGPGSPLAGKAIENIRLLQEALLGGQRGPESAPKR